MSLFYKGGLSYQDLQNIGYTDAINYIDFYINSVENEYKQNLDLAKQYGK